MKHFLVERDRICGDHESGATVIVSDILALLSRMLERTDAEAMVNQVRRYAADLMACHPSMAQAINLCRDVIEAPQDSSGVLIQAILTGWRIRLARQSEAVVGFASKEAAKVPRIITLSNSLLVADSLAAAGPGVRALVSESRPANEGLRLARRLAERGVRVEVVADAALPGKLQPGDAVLLGCDCLTNSYFVNKIGTFPLALAADSLGVPVYLLCPSSKFLTDERAIFYANKEQPTTEFHESAPEGVILVNQVFERVSLDLVSHIVSEDGVFTRRQFLDRPAGTPAT